jgi:hypothetical protein
MLLLAITGLATSCGGGQPSTSPTTAARETSPSPTTIREPSPLPTTVGESSPPSTAVSQPPSSPPAPATAVTATIAVDAVSGGAVDATRVVTGPSPFDVDIVVTKAGSGYQGYQYLFKWDPAIVAYEGEKDLKPAGIDICGTPTLESENTLYTGCAKLSQGALNYTGPVSTLTFHCVADGVSPLHLMTFAEDKDFGTSVLGWTGVIIETTLTDASVTCQGVGQSPATVPTTTP